jgi:hypothetical protein
MVFQSRIVAMPSAESNTSLNEAHRRALEDEESRKRMAD